jgi:putative phage-type endonuclease
MKQRTPEWLAARKDTIGSSDIPIIVGESTYKSAHTLAAEKLGLVTTEVDEETQELFDIGNLMQPVLLQIYQRKTGLRTRSSEGWRVHPEIPWATASLDGTAPVKRVVEAKWSNGARWRSGERVPGDVQAQVQWQLFVVGWDVADVVVMDRGTPRIETIERNDTMIDDLLFFAREFHGYLERGELPPVDGSESTRRTLAARHPRDNGVFLPQTEDLVTLTAQLAEARAAKKSADDAERTIGNALRAIIGDASGIDGLVSLKKNQDSQRTNWPAVAGAYRTMLEETTPTETLDALQSIHTDTVQGARVLRLLSRGSTE